MIEGLISLIVAFEVARTEVETQKTADAYYTEVAKKETVDSNNTTYKYTITYDISSSGAVKGDLEEFRSIVAETYADARGWKRAGVNFVEVKSGGKLHLVLMQAENVGKFNGCSSTLSCTVKPYIYINDTRWMNGSDSYNALGLSLLSYRQMLLNHETGHYLGHGHVAACETSTGYAPVMLQQSTGLRGCTANSWPLPNELWVKGI